MKARTLPSALEVSLVAIGAMFVGLVVRYGVGDVVAQVERFLWAVRP